MGAKVWTKQRVEELTELYLAKKPRKKIAEIMNMSVNAVRNEIVRLKLHKKYFDNKVWYNMVCDGNCFDCKYPDCIASYQDISKLDRLERQRRREEMDKFIKSVEVEMRERKSKCTSNINT